MNRSAWCFISGQVAARETRLLTDDDFSEWLRQGTIEALVARLRQVGGYEEVAGVGGEELAATIESVVAGELRRLAQESPEPGPAGMWLLVYDFQQVNRFVKAKAHKRAFEPLELSRLTVEDLERAWEGDVDASTMLREAMEAARRLIEERGDSPATDAGIDEALDRAELWTFMEEARKTGSEQIVKWSREYTEERTRLALTRARLAGMEPEKMTEMGRELMNPLALEEVVQSSAQGSMRELAKEAPAAGEDSGAALSRYAVEVDNRMTERLVDAKHVAFGPERVFGYAWGLTVERVNLKLIVEGILLHAPEETGKRLRRSYA